MALPHVPKKQRTLTQAELDWLKALQDWVQEGDQPPSYEQAMSDVQAAYQQQFEIEPPYQGKKDNRRNAADILAWRKRPMNAAQADMTPSRFDLKSTDAWKNCAQERYTSDTQYARHIVQEAKKEWVRSELNRYNKNRDRIYQDQEALRTSRRNLNKEHVVYVRDTGFGFWDYMILNSLFNNRAPVVNNYYGGGTAAGHATAGGSGVNMPDMGDSGDEAAVLFLMILLTLALSLVFILLGWGVKKAWEKANEEFDPTNGKIKKGFMIGTGIVATIAMGFETPAVFRALTDFMIKSYHIQPPVWSLLIVGFLGLAVAGCVGALMGYCFGAGAVKLRNNHGESKAIEIYEQRLEAALGKPLLQEGDILTPKWAQAMPYESHQHNQIFAVSPTVITAQPLHAQEGVVPSAPPANSAQFTPPPAYAADGFQY